MTFNKGINGIFELSACDRENFLMKLTLCRENVVDINNQF